MKLSFGLFFLSLSFFGCDGLTDNKLPVFGRTTYNEIPVDGQIIVDTVYHEITDFQFVNQDGQVVTHQTFEDKIYVADFFFTTCPTICPSMKAQMLRVYEAYQDDDEILLLSHTVDPKHDSVAVLKVYAEQLGIRDSRKWHFVTGDKYETYRLAQESYMVTALENDEAPGGVDHSGAFVLIDKRRRIRGIYNGTEKEDVDQLIDDIAVLKKEYRNR